MEDSEKPTEDSEKQSEAEPGVEDKASVNLKSETESASTVATSVDKDVIDLDKEQQPAKNATFEGETETAEPAESAKPEEHAEAIAEIENRYSVDTTDQIQMTMTMVDDDLSYQSPINIFGQKRNELGPVVEISSVSSDEEEEEVSDILSYLADFGIKEEREPINRAACEAEYAEAKEYQLVLRRRNGLLNKKIAEYYYKRKIMRVFDDCNIEMYESMLEKYEQKIYDLCELKIKTNREKEAVDNEISDMINLRDDQKEDLAKRFLEMQRREAEVMRGLIDSNTGKVISDKLIEKLLVRQKSKSEIISEIRLDYIKRRDKIKALEQKIKTLETIGGTLHLMDFEQLRMENQTYTDKIEERDDELMRLRERYYHAVQANAHIREKINVIEAQIEDLQEKSTIEEDKLSNIREHSNKLKMERDMYRAKREKLKINTGLLTYPKFLMDMEDGITITENMHQEIDDLIAKNKVNRIKLNNIRKTIEKTEHLQARKSVRKLKLSRAGNKFFHSRNSKFGSSKPHK